MLHGLCIERYVANPTSFSLGRHGYQRGELTAGCMKTCMGVERAQGPRETCVEKHVENKAWSCDNCAKTPCGQCEATRDDKKRLRDKCVKIKFTV